MVIVDTHVHASPYWFEPVEILVAQMKANRVRKATLVQFIGQTDNGYILECARRFPGRFSPIVIVDSRRAGALKVLRQLVKEGAEGVRLEPANRSPGKDPLAIWRACAELGLPVTCRGTEEEFASDEFRKLVKALPDVSIIIEHLGYVPPDEPSPYTTYRRVMTLAEFPNTYIKLGGLGEICARPFPFRQPRPFATVPPFIQMAYEAFGPSRMMWGSNSPLCSQLEGYGNTLRYLSEYLSSLCSEKDKRRIFGETALSLFRFGKNQRRNAQHKAQK